MNRFVLAAVLMCAPASPAHAQETAYFAAIPDLPVATGLVEVAAPAPPISGGVRLLFAEARGAASVGAVRAFYVDSLSELGWAREPSLNPNDTVFLRGRERLFLLIGERDGETLLRVRLVTNNAVMTAD